MHRDARLTPTGSADHGRTDRGGNAASPRRGADVGVARRRRRGDGGPVLETASITAPHAETGRRTGVSAAPVEASGGHRGWSRCTPACPRRRCTRTWSGTTSTGSPGSTARPDASSAAANAPPGRADPSRHRQSRRDPARRRPAGPRPRPGRERPGRLHVPALCGRRPLAGGPCRSPRRRTSRNAGRAPVSNPGLVPGPRHDRRRRDVRQRIKLPEPAFPPCRPDGQHRHRRTRPYRPRSNGKVERFNLTIADGLLHSFTFRSDNERRRRPDRRVHDYNHHRNHTAIGGPPASHVHNLCGSYNQPTSTEKLVNPNIPEMLTSKRLIC